MIQRAAVVILRVKRHTMNIRCTENPVYLVVLHYFEELNLEFECGSRGYSPATSCISVGKFRRNNKCCLSAFLHHRKTLLPPFDNLAKLELDRGLSVDRRIENGAIGERTVVVHFNLVVDSWRLSITFFHFIVYQARLRLFSLLVAIKKTLDVFFAVLVMAVFHCWIAESIYESPAVRTHLLDSLHHALDPFPQELVHLRPVLLQDIHGI